MSENYRELIKNHSIFTDTLNRKLIYILATNFSLKT